MNKKIASACGYAFAKCMKFYLFSMLPAVWFWFPILCIAEFFDKNITFAH